MRSVLVLLLALVVPACAAPRPAAAPAAPVAHAAAPRVLSFAALTADALAALDRERTVLVLPGGVLEQHGPHLPVGTDGIANQHLAAELARSLAARPGWTVVVLPHLPLGVGGANEIGGKPVWPGSVGVRVETLRAVYLDLATQLGDQGFRWLFVVQGHGSPLHNQAIDDACAYFDAHYPGGRMVNLTGLVIDGPGPGDLGLTAAERAENGVDLHAGMSETSRMLHLRPALVGPVDRLRAWGAASFTDLLALTARPGWPGYVGSPRLATAARGAAIWRALRDPLLRYAHAVLDRAPLPPAVPFARLALEDPAEAAVVEGSLARDREMAGRQRRWLARPPAP